VGTAPSSRQGVADGHAGETLALTGAGRALAHVCKVVRPGIHELPDTIAVLSGGHVENEGSFPRSICAAE
jgi:hypothetical protein